MEYKTCDVLLRSLLTSTGRSLREELFQMHRRAHTFASTLDPKGLWSLGCQALENCPHFVLESPRGLNGGGNMPKECPSAAVGVLIVLSFVHRQIFRCLGFFQIKLDPEFPDFRMVVFG